MRLVESSTTVVNRIEPQSEADAASARLAAERRHSMRGDLREIVADLWRHRELLYQITRRDIRIRYKQTVMGLAWALFLPALIVFAGVLVRFIMAQVSGTALEVGDLAAVTVKALPWAFFVGAVNFATPSLTGNMGLVTKIYFPREVLPISAVLTQSFDTAVGGVAFLLALPLLGVLPSTGWLWAGLIGLNLFLFTIAACLFLACANLFFRDVKYIVQVLLMFGIFFTPVFFVPAELGPLGSQLMLLNPVAPMLEGIRLGLVDGHNLLRPLADTDALGRTLAVWSPWYLLTSALWAGGGVLGAALLFHRSEYLFAEYV